jgi:hypothetical protein
MEPNLPGNCGQYLSVLNCASEYGLSLLTCGRLWDLVTPRQFQDVVSNPTDEIKRKYGDRSIAKEIDQVLSIIRAEYSGDGTLGLSITGSSTQTFDFNKVKSDQFHKVVAGRQTGYPQTIGRRDEPIETIAIGGRIHDIMRLQRQFGPGRWRKLKGFEMVRLQRGVMRKAELHSYEAHGIGRKKMKIKRFLD